MIRHGSQHKKCATCIKYKLFIRKLKKDPGARRLQVQLYHLHLRRQYADRTIYWSLRSLSRMGPQHDSTRQLVIALDSMERAKFAWPRHECMSAKDFAKFLRPTLSVTGCIAHGWAAGLFVSDMFVQKDSAYTIECISHMLHRLSQNPSLNLRETEVVLIGDNASKEMKNNGLMRLLSGLVLTKRIRCGSLMFLESGHSHEDWDQWFSQLTSHLTTQRTLETPAAYVRDINAWVNRPESRPHEPDKFCIKVDQTRAWKLHLNMVIALLLRPALFIPSNSIKGWNQGLV